MPVERIAAFIRGESGEGFGELALAAFRHQYETGAAFRRLCDRRGATPERIASWRDVPLVPMAELEALTAADGPARPVDPGDLSRTAFARSFSTACLGGMRRPPVLSLLPGGARLRGSATGLAVDPLPRPWAAPDSRSALAPRGVEVAKARSFLAGRQRDRRATLVLGTAETLAQLLAGLERRGLRFRLPPGSRVVESEAAGPGDRDLLRRIAEGLAVPAESVVREYAASGRGSRFYAGHDRRGEPRPFRPPPWTRVRLLDPGTLAAVPADAAGAVAVFDLAAPGSAVHLLTTDLGVAAGEGFRLAGPAAGPG